MDISQWAFYVVAGEQVRVRLQERDHRLGPAVRPTRSASTVWRTPSKRPAIATSSERPLGGSATGNDLVLSNLANPADKHWVGKLPAMGTHRDLHSFKGLYAVLYRQYSGTAHPSYLGLNHVVEDVTTIRKRVVVEKPPEGRGPFGMATVVYGLGLYVAADSLGWPSAASVTAAFDRYPGLA